MKKELLRMNELEKYEVIKECIKTKCCTYLFN